MATLVAVAMVILVAVAIANLVAVAMAVLAAVAAVKVTFRTSTAEVAVKVASKATQLVHPEATVEAAVLMPTDLVILHPLHLRSTCTFLEELFPGERS